MELHYAEARTILRCIAGSRADGLATEDSDCDELGVMVEELEDAIKMGAGEGFQQFIFRTAVVRGGKINVPSQPGDLDLKLYSLRKFCALACDGNPEALAMLFMPTNKVTLTGARLQKMADLFVSKLAIPRYLGYMAGQRGRMFNGLTGKSEKRQKLVVAYGYDVKEAASYLKLGEQCLELLTTGCLSYPIPEPARGRLLAVRNGHWTHQNVIERGLDLEEEIKEILERSELRDTPDRVTIQKWMQETYRTAWIWGRRP